MLISLLRECIRAILLEVEDDHVDRVVDALPRFEAEWFPSSVEAVDTEAVFKKPVVNAVFPLKKKDEKLAVVANLSVDVIEPAQPYLYKKELKNYMRNTPPELPLVVLFNGRYFAQNHRRIAAQILKGQNKIRVRLLKYDDRYGYSRPEVDRDVT